MKHLSKYQNEMSSAALIVSFFKILISLEIKLPKLNFPLSIFYDCILETDFALFDVFHYLTQQSLEHLADGHWIMY